MRIGIFTETYTPYISGLVTSEVMLKDALERLGHTVYVVTANLESFHYDYDEKEALIHELFSKSNVPNTELFAVNIDLVVQLLSSLEGTQIFPKSISKEEAFSTATDEIQKNTYGVNKYLVPNGVYYISEKIKNAKNIKATMRVENGKFIVLKGSQCLPCNKDWMPETRRTAKIENGILMEDVECNSPSTAGWVVLGNANNGWITWKTEDGKSINLYRNNKKDQ